MGFIDYRGTKENRYTDVLEYAKAQQEEEARRLKDERVGKWVAKYIGDSRYSGISFNDLIKYIIVRYKNLTDKKNAIIVDYEELEIDPIVLWKDFSIALIVRRLEDFELTDEKKHIYYRTFMEKVFRVTDYTSSEEHYRSTGEIDAYRQYFAVCFDLIQEKQFWKWLGVLGKKHEAELIEFIEIYRQLSILLGYYLFLGIRPKSDNWMQRLEIETQALECLKSDYGKGIYRQPNYGKLQNPLYKFEKRVRNNEWTDKVKESFTETGFDKTIDEPIRPKRPQLDRARFEELLSSGALSDYTVACQMLRSCGLPEKMDTLYKELMIRIPVLKESIDKFEEVYKPDMNTFYEYYIPEALHITVTYLEYLDVGLAESILQDTEDEVLDTISKLLLAVNDKIDEIYKFASIEIKAKAKALEALMSQDGYVNSEYKINK